MNRAQRRAQQFGKFPADPRTHIPGRHVRQRVAVYGPPTKQTHVHVTIAHDEQESEQHTHMAADTPYTVGQRVAVLHDGVPVMGEILGVSPEVAFDGSQTAYTVLLDGHTDLLGVTHTDILRVAEPPPPAQEEESE